MSAQGTGPDEEALDGDVVLPLPPFAVPGDGPGSTPPATSSGAGHRLEAFAPAIDAVPGLARVAASAALHTAEWSVKTSARTGWRLAKALRSPEEASALAREATQVAATVGELARSVSGGTPLDQALRDAGSSLGEPGHVAGHHQRHHRDQPDPEEPERGSDDLRRRGADLLERSRDVWDDDSAHPAYGRILGELAPDEARVLLLLLQHGPQPSVDVRTGGPIGLLNSQLIAPGLTMIGARAGCRYLDQVPSYLNNLFRLGLVWFSRESLRDPMPYQVVEAQPDVLAAVHSVKFAKVVRRSIHLTPFGEDFCRTVLVEEHVAGTPFPEHGTPPASEAGEPPSHS
ncbi:MAG: DUF4393 domain-containing protein [Nocardioides sp.]|nr:DUF4393 domain-containing protein [Nocardioides sp.]